MAMKPIVVTGDLVRDHYLYPSPTAPLSPYDPSPATVLREARGGAWYLSELVKRTCAGRNPEVWVPSNDSAAGRSFSLQAKYPQNTGGDKKQTAMRIAKFLGCERPRTTGSPALSQPVDDKRRAAPKDGEVLLIDDLGLGFNRSRVPWPVPLKQATWPGIVVMKTSSANSENALLEHLLRGPFLDRLTVIVSADVLRTRGAAISQALSWDQTIEEMVHEFTVGCSSRDLARCGRVIVWFGRAGVMSFARRPDQGERLVGFERLLYHPDELEGDWEAQRPGLTFGAGSFLAATLTRHAIDPASFPLTLALENALAASKLDHEHGFNSDPAAVQTLVHSDSVLTMLKRPRFESAEKPAYGFYSAFRGDAAAAASPGGRSDILARLTGTGLEYVAAKATEVVLRGTDQALGPAPKARYGDFLTVDREEIERINQIRRLAEVYLNNLKDRRPLSIAVFGPPGSGKSFAIKQLAEVLFREKREPLTFNLSGFGSEGLPRLQEAFHRVRDGSVQGKVPLVFWDEFDADDLDWLKHFLAPMQDAEFRGGSLVYPIGRALFVFAGGTKSTFSEFDLSSSSDPTFIAKKGPDFVSRLRGYIDIKGPNPTGNEPARDPAHLIRRAVMLRSLLERSYPELIDPVTKQAGVSAGVVKGLLRVARFRHGARSLESLVNTSRLAGARYFGPSQLPPPDLLSLYVSPDFMKHVAEGEIEPVVIEALAEAQHRNWRKLRKSQGWKYGRVRHDPKKLHDRLVDYDRLSEPQKEDNRGPARLVSAKLHEVGYAISPRTPDGPASNPTPTFPVKARDRLLRIEHDIWMRDHLLRGFERAATTDESLRLHRAVAHYDDLLDEDRKLDNANVDVIPELLWKKGYMLVRAARKKRRRAGRARR
jgi:hypothetical protein